MQQMSLSYTQGVVDPSFKCKNCMKSLTADSTKSAISHCDFLYKIAIWTPNAELMTQAIARSRISGS
jgi:hypothetical protein